MAPVSWHAWPKSHVSESEKRWRLLYLPGWVDVRLREYEYWRWAKSLASATFQRRQAGWVFHGHQRVGNWKSQEGAAKALQFAAIRSRHSRKDVEAIVHWSFPFLLERGVHERCSFFGEGKYPS